MNYKLKQADFDKLLKDTNPYRTLKNFQKKTNVMEAQNTQWGQAYISNE